MSCFLEIGEIQFNFDMNICMLIFINMENYSLTSKTMIIEKLITAFCQMPDCIRLCWFISYLFGLSQNQLITKLRNYLPSGNTLAGYDSLKKFL